MIRTLALTTLIGCMMILSACTIDDEKSVIEDREGYTLLIAPSDQDPEEQYALQEVILTSSTIVDGKRNHLDALHVGDVITIDYAETDSSIAESITHK
ncbi:hypothetical protein ACFQO8_00460 [Exiguobacterium aestuarii]|uniref:DUF3221 domain-containing protein n=1 Tax=Exiguobacterium aestuarii TaxID=273527 RepID=A0ABW2PHQ2_9BACL|nr:MULTISPECIES: hypothetical protein [Exiguobacterium]MCT4786305.1 hypothetical protein [Exiguobacterium aestuarii]